MHLPGHDSSGAGERKTGFPKGPAAEHFRKSLLKSSEVIWIGVKRKCVCVKRVDCEVCDLRMLVSVLLWL